MNRDKESLEEIINRELVFQGNYLNLEKLDIRLPDGRIGKREIVRVGDAVAVLPLDEKGNVHLVRQHRPAIRRTILEIPAGIIDENEAPEDAASRECEEETGYRPAKLKALITYAHAEGYSSGFITLFFGTELEYTGNIHLDASEYVEPVSMPFGELLKMVKDNQFIDSKTILSTLLSEKLFSK